MAASRDSHLQTVVFVGPSAPQEAIRAALPDAFLAPPIQRGDLYKYRLLNFSVFVIIDGIFTNALAVSPREVVDTLRDGGAIIGASSMGALRAADCAPAGAQGYGRIYRLFRRRVLSSEDEVAVATLPAPPFAPLSRSLVDIRFALRMACRKGDLPPDMADQLLKCAMDMPYTDRTWKRIAQSALVALSSDQIKMLESRSVKHVDAIGCCHRVAKQLSDGHISARARTDRKAPLGALFVERERGWAPLDGEDPDTIRPEFAEWLWATGKGCSLIGPERFARIVGKQDILSHFAEIDLLSPGGETAALLLQFAGHRRSIATAREMSLQATEDDIAQAKKEVIAAHEAITWEVLLEQGGRPAHLSDTLMRYVQARSQEIGFSKSVLFSSNNPGIPSWNRPFVAS